jgi:short-subunit dehydrogenase
MPIAVFKLCSPCDSSPHVCRGHTRIVVVSSMAAVVPAPGQAVYSATKLASHGYFLTLQSELNDRYSLYQSPHTVASSV